nr:LLM class F420-dependent oxidoreductase [Micromonospora sp. DSM 115978]
NLFDGPDVGRKLDVLREHCEREGRDYDSIEKTVYYIFEPGEDGAGANKIIDDLGALAELGVDMAVGQVADVWKIAPLEVLGAQVVPAAAKL